MALNCLWMDTGKIHHVHFCSLRQIPFRSEASMRAFALLLGGLLLCLSSTFTAA